MRSPFSGVHFPSLFFKIKPELGGAKGAAEPAGGGEGRRGKPADVLWGLEPRPRDLGPREARRAGAVR